MEYIESSSQDNISASRISDMDQGDAQTGQSIARVSQLPNEIMLQILGHIMTLPNGVHGDRWDTLKAVRMDKFSISQNITQMAREAFYKSNTIIVKPKEYRLKDSVKVPGQPKSRTGNDSAYMIRYPTVEQSQ
jgi:hypothetical protein